MRSTCDIPNPIVLHSGNRRVQDTTYAQLKGRPTNSFLVHLARSKTVRRAGFMKSTARYAVTKTRLTADVM